LCHLGVTAKQTHFSHYIKISRNIRKVKLFAIHWIQRSTKNYKKIKLNEHNKSLNNNRNIKN